MRDYHGREITVEEGPDTLIRVWTIQPALSNDYDSVVNRCYQDAVAYATRVVEDLMDDPDVELPIKITIDQQTMRLSTYQEIVAGD